MLASDFINANFVGYNHEAAVSNLFAERFWFKKPCFYCTSHSFAKNHSSPAAYSLLNFKKQLMLPKQNPCLYAH